MAILNKSNLYATRSEHCEHWSSALTFPLLWLHPFLCSDSIGWGCWKFFSPYSCSCTLILVFSLMVSGDHSFLKIKINIPRNSGFIMWPDPDPFDKTWTLTRTGAQGESRILARPLKTFNPMLRRVPWWRSPYYLTPYRLSQVVQYLAGCGLQSCAMLVSKGYPDIGWNPVEGERYLDFLRFAVFCNGSYYFY